MTGHVTGVTGASRKFLRGCDLLKQAVEELRAVGYGDACLYLANDTLNLMYDRPHEVLNRVLSSAMLPSASGGDW